MKTKILTKIAIASMLSAPACAVEHGVVICKEKSPTENALYVNLIKKDKSTQKPLHDQTNEAFDADRKLFFMDNEYQETFNYIWAGDTISFRNGSHATFINMNKHHRIRDINGVRECKFIDSVHARALQKQR